MRRRSFILHVVVVAATLAGCVDTFRGSNVQIDLPESMPSQAPYGIPPASGDIPYAAHFSLYGIQHGDGREILFELQRFEIHKIVDVSSPCFLDVGAHVEYQGLHVSQFGAQVLEDTGIPDVTMAPPSATEEQRIRAATAVQRMQNVAALGGSSGIKVVTSAAAREYAPIAPDCTVVAGMIPPPSCRDTAANAQRLALCQAAWDENTAFWEGTDRILTSPLNGTTFGMVDGRNPVNQAPVGGAQWFVDEDLDTMDAYALYWQYDNLADQGTGTLLMYGTPEVSTRGVRHVELVAPGNPLFNADLVIFSDLDEDDVHF